MPVLPPEDHFFLDCNQDVAQLGGIHMLQGRDLAVGN